MKQEDIDREEAQKGVMEELEKDTFSRLSMGNELDKAALIPALQRKQIPREGEWPVPKDIENWTETYDLYSGRPVWEETDDSFRLRTKNHLQGI